MSGTLVSVLIPTFNSATWIAETLESVHAQEHRPLEIVIADNGSTDGTVDAARRAAPEAKVVHVAARGAGAARNAALDAASGSVLQFLDSDDLLEPAKIVRQLATLEASAADVVWGPFWTYERGDDAVWRRTRRVVPDVVDGPAVAEQVLGSRGFIQLGAMLIRRTPRISALRFDNGDCIPVEDVRYVVDMALAGARFHRLDADSGLLFRQHDLPRWSSGSAARFWAGCEATARAAEEHWRREGALSPSQVSTLASVYVQAARAFYGPDRARFERTVAHLRRLDPDFERHLPRRMRMLARVAGFGTAEAIAGVYRRMRGRDAAGAR